MSEPTTNQPVNAMDLNTTFEVTVAGQRVQKPLTEILKGYEKAAGADRRFEEAAEIRKEADRITEEGKRGIEIVRTYEKLLQPNPPEADLRRWYELMGHTRTEINELIYGSSGNSSGGQPITNDSAPRRTITENDLDPTLRAKLQMASETAQTTKQQEFMTQVGNLLDKNQKYVQLVQNLAADKKQQLKDILIKQAMDEALHRMTDGRQNYSPELVRKVTDLTVQSAEQFGMLIAPPSPQSGESDNLPGTYFSTGFGSAGASAGVASQVAKPVERAAVNDPDYAENFAQRTLQRVQQMLRRK